MKEHWRRVLGYEQYYAVSNLGRVFSFRKEDLLSPHLKAKKKNKHLQSCTYWHVEFNVNGITKKFPVHKLVLDAFRGPRKERQECRHLDGDPLNNQLDNLEWGSFLENREDWRKHRKRIVLTPENVKYIRSSDKPLRVLAKELGCAKSTIAHAKGYWRTIE